MKKHLEISKYPEEEKRLEQEAFLKLSDDGRFRVVCELSEILLKIQFENGVLPKENNFTLTK